MASFHDMSGRAPGPCTSSNVGLLQPGKRYSVPYNKYVDCDGECGDLMEREGLEVGVEVL